MSLLEKVEVVDKSNREMNIAAARYHYGVNECPIFFIKKNECRIKETSMASAPLSANISLLSHCSHSLKIRKGPCVPQLADYNPQWCSGEGEGHANRDWSEVKNVAIKVLL
jgi:hypothetical protein